MENVKWQMGIDRKATALKTLQGLIWVKGYKDGTIKGQYVYFFLFLTKNSFHFKNYKICFFFYF